MGKGKPFLEVLALALNEDYRFPILEVFSFLYILATFVYSGPATQALAGMGEGITGESMTFILLSSLTEFPLFVFVMLLLKNVAYGVGNDLEKGVIQTYLSYPLKRRLLLTAKLLSSLGISILALIGIQTFAFFLIASDIISPYMSTILLTYAGTLSFPLLVAGLVLILALFLKRGGIALVVGIILYLGSEVLSFLLIYLAISTTSDIPLKIASIIDPMIALKEHFRPGMAHPLIGWLDIWSVSFGDALLHVGAGYVLVILVYAIAYLYFERRSEI